LAEERLLMKRYHRRSSRAMFHHCLPYIVKALKHTGRKGVLKSMHFAELHGLRLTVNQRGNVNAFVAGLIYDQYGQLGIAHGNYKLGEKYRKI
jgi:hypothetical protein